MHFYNAVDGLLAECRPNPVRWIFYSIVRGFSVAALHFAAVNSSSLVFRDTQPFRLSVLAFQKFALRCWFEVTFFIYR